MTTNLDRVMWLLVAAMCLTVPAWAQVDLTGTWVELYHEDNQDRLPGSELVNYTGLPINDDARSRALSYDPINLSLPERQCIVYPPWYIVLGPSLSRISVQIDETTRDPIAWIIRGIHDRATITIWTDGRPHPSEHAPHTDTGFTTGVWEGNTLKAYTTHIKEGPLRRTGVPASSRTTLTTYISRHSNDLLTMTMFIEDPVYLEEPHVISRHWRREQPGRRAAANAQRPCTPAAEIPEPRGAEGDGTVPHYLPGEHPALKEFATMYGLPMEAALGGPATLYPEYQKKLKGVYVRPDKCVRYCCSGGVGAGGPMAEKLECITDGTGTIR